MPTILLIEDHQIIRENTAQLLELAGYATLLAENGELGVYEHEKGLFFNDHSQQPLQDALLVRLLAHPNALVTGHQGFLTHDALTNIATTTLETLGCWLVGAPAANELLPSPAAAVLA